MKYLLLTSAMLVYVVNSNAQTHTDSTATGYFDNFLNIIGERPPKPVRSDSIFRDIFFFDKVSRAGDGFPRSGGPGSATLNLVRGFPEARKIRAGFVQYDHWLMHPVRQLPSDSSVRRWSNVEYHIASRKEQHLFLSHHQRIKPWIKAGIDFGAFAGEGDYTHQKNSNKYFDAWLAIGTKDRAYRAYVGFTSNNVLNQENGGITSDSIFEHASSLNTRTLPINLSTAEARLRTRDYLAKQELDLINLFSGVPDSLEIQNHKLLLSNSIWWSRKSWLFTSLTPDSNYFETAYFDSSATYDSSFVDDLYSQSMIEYSYQPLQGGPVYSVGTGLNFQAVDYFTYDTDTLFKNAEGLIRLSLTSKKVSVSLFGTSSVSGDFEKLFSYALDVNYNLNSLNRFSFMAAMHKYPQVLRDLVYKSNHFIWNNNFSAVESKVFRVSWDSDKLMLSVSAQTQMESGKVVYGKDHLPDQYNEELSYGSVSVIKTFRVGRFGSDLRLSASWSDHENIVPITPYSVYASVYYKSSFFKKALGFKGGFDVSTWGPYYLYGYMPATGSFFIQDEKESGNYPMVSVFVTMRIKTAALFLRLDHANEGFNDRSYYGGWHQPMPGRTIKFGVTWDLVD